MRNDPSYFAEEQNAFCKRFRDTRFVNNQSGGERILALGWTGSTWGGVYFRADPLHSLVQIRNGWAEERFWKSNITATASKQNVGATAFSRFCMVFLYNASARWSISVSISCMYIQYLHMSIFMELVCTVLVHYLCFCLLFLQVFLQNISSMLRRVFLTIVFSLCFFLLFLKLFCKIYFFLFFLDGTFLPTWLHFRLYLPQIPLEWLPVRHV